jgi:endoglucanase
MDKHFLIANGSTIVNAEGQPVMLRGFGLGGWMNMENFITGFPANEEAHREALRAVLGEENYTFFFEHFLEYFFGEDDAAFIASLGLNLLRIPLNYRHFESDMEPFVIKQEGFKQLDRVVELCAKHHIYVILDLHSLPGYQNQAWHCDNPTHYALFWQHKHFQDRVVHLWEVLADRYKDQPWIAGYNPMNEPGDVSGAKILSFYRRLYEAIRAIDPDHLLFFEGNRYAQDFHLFDEPWPNVVYSAHDYANPGLITGGPYPGITLDKCYRKQTLEETFLSRTAYMQQHHVPCWIGEFGPVYVGDAEADAMRYQILRDQLEIYQRYQAHWAIWTYKDIGLQGVVSTAPDGPWMQHIQPFLEKKARLGVDTWDSLDSEIRHILQPLEETFAREFPEYHPFPFGSKWMIHRLVRGVLLAEPLVPEFAALFQGLNQQELDTLLRSFQFNNCVQRTPLASLLTSCIM